MADEKLVVTKGEANLAKQVADMYGISEEEAAELIVKKEVERRVRIRTGKGPAKIYGMKKKG